MSRNSIPLVVNCALRDVACRAKFLFVREVSCTVILLVFKGDFVACRLEYIVCNRNHLWNHYGYWWNSVGNMFLHGKVSIIYAK